jgi:hypothetical protein
MNFLQRIAAISVADQQQTLQKVSYKHRKRSVKDSIDYQQTP